MKTRIIVSAILLPIFFAVLFVFPPYILTAVISVICAIAAHELLHATGTEKSKSIVVYTITIAAIVPIAIYINNIYLEILNSQFSILNSFAPLLITFFILMSLLIIEVVLKLKTEKQIKFRQIPIALAAGIAIPYMLSSLISLKTMPYGHLFVLLPIISAFLTDSGAYFTGITIGKKQAFPTISPNKTVEGCVGGVIIGTAGMMIYGVILSGTTPLTIIYPALIVYGILGALVTELGDLTFSLIKRKCDIKDYGTLIPGHGGMLDRFDSMTLAAPTMYLLVILLPAIIVN